MITFEDALTARSFHEPHKPEGKIRNWRRNGRTQTWKTRPGQFKIPVKFGLRTYAYIHEYDTDFHTAENCPNHHSERTT